MSETVRDGWKRWTRLLLALVAIHLVLGLLLIAPDFYRLLVPRWVTRALVIGFLQVSIVAYWAGLALSAGLLLVQGPRLLRAGRPRGDARSARLVLLAGSVLFGLACGEAAAALWLARAHRFPGLPTRFAGSAPAGHGKRDRTILVIGESSARGEPYEEWLSIAHIVAWQLERADPERKVKVEMWARGGATLEQAHQKLAGLQERPDAILVYAGHNEFQSRFSWYRNVPHYIDEDIFWYSDVLDRLGRRTWLGQWMVETMESQRLDRPPARKITRDLVDVPSFSEQEARAVRDEYRDRLAAIAQYCHQIGALPIFIVPAGNDAGYEPNRSFLPPSMSSAQREDFRRRFREAEGAAAKDPARGIELYRALVYEQPGFAEVHYQLAGLLRRAEDLEGARRHFNLARDLDGMPQRCTTTLMEACREAGRNNNALLVDAPRVLASLVSDGIIDDRLYHDAHHTNLTGYIALAREVLQEIRQGGKLDWPPGREVPRIDPEECAAHFGVGLPQWAAICRRSGGWYRADAYVRFDPEARLAKAERLEAAARLMEAGTKPEDAGAPGYGCHPRLETPALSMNSR